MGQSRLGRGQPVNGREPNATKVVILNSQNGTRYRVTVANGGTLSVVAA